MSLNRKSRASHWSVTAFFDTSDTPSKETREYQIEEARTKGWIVDGQIEKCPTTGALHYQLSVKTLQVRAGAVMDVFPKAHIEIARNGSALQNYVHKEKTSVEQLKSVSLAIIWPVVRDKFFEWVVEMGYQSIEYHERRMEVWDEFINDSVAQGVQCELIGVNPQYRSCIMKYWTGHLRRQTDRQTDSEEVSLPMYTQDAS